MWIGSGPFGPNSPKKRTSILPGRPFWPLRKASSAEGAKACEGVWPNRIGSSRGSSDVPTLVARVAAEARSGDIILGMSNGSFGGFHAALLAELRKERA